MASQEQMSVNFIFFKIAQEEQPMMSRPKVACEDTFHHLEINQTLRTSILDKL